MFFAIRYRLIQPGLIEIVIYLKGFAAGCSREVIERGAAQLGWELDKLLTMTLEAMAANEDLINSEMESEA